MDTTNSMQTGYADAPQTLNALADGDDDPQFTSGPVPAPGRRGSRTTVDLVVPVYNEQAQLADTVYTLLGLTAESANDVTIVIADNASTDRTGRIGEDLARLQQRVRYVRLDRKGRGRALNQVWSASRADVVAYTDVDLATDIRLLDPMVQVLASGTADVAIASRLLPDSNVVRGPKREVISRCYNRLLKLGLDVGYSDAQCGFKALSRRAADALLPHVSDVNWFFDTEVLTLAQWAGLRIHEFSADWTDDPDSSVDVVATAFEDLKGMARMRRDLRRSAIPLERISAEVGRPAAVPNLGAQIMHFVDVGIVSTVTYSLGFLLLGMFLDVNLANFTALLASAVLNTALNRRHTFAARNPRGKLAHHLKGLAVFALCWLLTSAAIQMTTGLPTVAVLVAVTVANVGATVLRFALQRLWVFADTQRRASRPRTASHYASRSEGDSTTQPKEH
ncbi:glycosyltransferase [Brevibacterium sp. 50QC2O2]|uniref:glycosyltransferase n=1 Tax=Brevibacterium sp. 50QC2O2 TaxID=2968459 RepID=UPI00211C16DA|nr:glycosyltransferase [Brevibacterium sp. 50QC2O2]MCQ9389373.1 glycosyltransferase [Brevibacterium sp. 50QC2O2]